MEVKLVMFRNDGKRKDFPLLGPTTLIGRGEGCDLRVPVLSVSRRHCEITIEDDEVMARDLGSSNGTYINNKKITEQELQAGDRLVVGPVVFTVQINGEPEEVQQVKTKGQKLSESALGAEIVVGPQNKEDTGAAIATGEEDPISALEDMVAETLKDEDEEEDQAK